MSQRPAQSADEKPAAKGRKAGEPMGVAAADAEVVVVAGVAGLIHVRDAVTRAILLLPAMCVRI